MAQTQLIPEAVKSTILLKLKSYEASTLAAVALFFPQPVTLKTSICIRLSRFYFCVVGLLNAQPQCHRCEHNQLLAPSCFFFLRCAWPFPHLIFVYFPWKTLEVRNAGVWCFCTAFSAPMALVPSRLTFGESAVFQRRFCLFLFF